MKAFYVILVISMLGLISCNDSTPAKDKIAVELEGNWNMLDGSHKKIGSIEFTWDESFTMDSERGNVYGNYSAAIEDGYIAIIYAEDSDGEYLLSEDDEDNGWTCPVERVSKNTIKMRNLPLYRDAEVTLNKK